MPTPVRADVLHDLASTWLPALPDLHRRLRSAQPARVLDLGCGLGASSVALAHAYPRAQVLGVELDEASVTEARAQAAEAGFADSGHLPSRGRRPARLRGPVRCAARHGRPGGGAAGGPRAAGRRRQRPVGDERVADAFTAPGDPVERLTYGWSDLHCLPATLAEHAVEATGTVLRTLPLAAGRAAAGFIGFEVLPIDNPLWRFYRMYS